MEENVNFIQGRKEQYSPSEMLGGLFFSKDSKEILLNGESYGNATPADEEDITAKNSNLKLKDRTYNPGNFSGKGYIILRKNIQEVTVSKYDLTITSGCTANGNITIAVNSIENTISVTTDYSTPEQVASLIANSIEGSSLDGAVVSFSTQPTYNFNSTGVQGSVSDASYTENRNILTQSMINKSNTIYEIRYDFDLNGAHLGLPNNIILRFNGGSINNGRLSFGSNVEVINPNFNCEQAGTFAEKNSIDFYRSIENFKKYNGARLGDIVYIGIQNRLIAYKIGYTRDDVYNKTHGIEIEGTNLIASPFNGNNKRIFDVSAYGIVPDGTDMSDKLNTLIQQGITWEIASAILFFPAGTYVFKKPILFKSLCGIMGELSTRRPAAKNLGTVFDFSDIEFDDSDNERFCIKGAYGISSVRNIEFFSNSYSLVEDRWSLLTDNNIDNVWEETIAKENVNCIKEAGIVNECKFMGFSGTAIHGGFSHIYYVNFEQCNICISPVTDSIINNIFAYHCNTIINRALAETLISDIRGDSIRKHAFDNCRNSTIFKNIMLDWYYQSPFNIIGSNSSLSSYGSNTIIIDQCCSRGVVNPSLKDQSNITDENTFDKIGYINCSSVLGLTTVKFANNIRIIGGASWLNDRDKSYVIPNVGWSINANYDIIITGKIEITLYDIDIKNALSDYSIFRRFIEVLNGSVSGKVYLNNEPFELIKLSKGKYNKDTIKYIGKNLIPDNGLTEKRPTSISSGFQYFDTTLNKPIWWTGTEWVDSNGETI